MKNKILSKPSVVRAVRSSCIVIAGLMSASLCVASHTSGEIVEVGKWYERSFEQILNTKILTATRKQIDLQRSPHAATVYTAADIERMGIRNIKELLERTPGFFINKQAAGPAIGSRGFIGDNEQFLLLIDGHNANSIVDKGPGNFFLFPMLTNVARVEIIRGPGSTLWGSDAAMGIIHIITKSGGDVDGTAVEYSQASEDNYRYLNMQMGERIADHIDYLASFTLSESDGFYLDPEAFFPRAHSWESIDSSWEMYFKANIQDLKVYARMSDFKNVRPGGSTSGLTFEAHTRRRHSYLDLERNWAIDEGVSVDVRVFSDLMERWQSLITPIITPGTTMVEESGASREMSLGVELLARWELLQSHNLLLGVRAVRTEVDPVSFNRVYPVTTESSSVVATNDMKVVPEDADKNVAIFIEDEWQVTEDINLLVGFRLDNNSLRENSTIILPRSGLNWLFADHWVAQYSYNTGYIRPPVGLGFLGQGQFNSGISASSNGKIYGAADSEEVSSHELRIAYQNKPLSVSASLYSTEIDDSFNFIFEPSTIDGDEAILVFVNTPRIKTEGLEVEFKYVPSPSWNLYGNLSYVFDASIKEFTANSFGIDFDLNNTTYGFGEGIFTDEGTVVGYPDKILNIGANYFYSDNVSANVHFRMWSGLKTRDKIDIVTFDEGEKSYGPEYFLDANIQFKKVWGSGLNVSIFGKNLLDNNDSKIGMLYFTQEWTDRARSVGMNIQYTF